MEDATGLLAELRPRAFAVAYRMLGSVSEAEDVVQEALLRVHQAVSAGEDLRSPAAFVTTVTTRLAITELQSARARREQYVGDWLPEPIVTGSAGAGVAGNDPCKLTKTFARLPSALAATTSCTGRFPALSVAHFGSIPIRITALPGTFPFNLM